MRNVYTEVEITLMLIYTRG